MLREHYHKTNKMEEKLEKDILNFSEENYDYLTQKCKTLEKKLVNSWFPWKKLYCGRYVEKHW